MKTNKKVLVLGCGAMGVYLVPELIRMGYEVTVAALDNPMRDDSINIITGNCKDEAFLGKLLANEYDGIVDFLKYHTEEFKESHKKLLSATDHYIYLSSYRIYAGDYPITEESPRLLDVSDNQVYLATDDYSLFKARGEDILKASEFSNWTAIRPAITYSKRRFQLVTLESGLLLPRTRAGKKIVLPEDAMQVEATMSWAGDVAKMIARLLFNDANKREIFTTATAEHNPWQTVAEYYRKLIGLDYVAVPKEDFIGLFGDSYEKTLGNRWQLDYDRLFHRIVDNTKILNATGMKQSELMPLYDGLKLELSRLPEVLDIPEQKVLSDRMDAYLAKM
nr:epimerase [Clostridia bacterium]